LLREFLRCQPNCKNTLPEKNPTVNYQICCFYRELHRKPVFPVLDGFFHPMPFSDEMADEYKYIFVEKTKTKMETANSVFTKYTGLLSCFLK